MLVRVAGALLATAFALLAVIDPLLGIAGAVTVALAVGFFRSATFGVCAFFACTYLEIVTTYTGSPALSPIKVCGGALILIAVLDLATRTRHGARRPAPAWAGHPVIVAAMLGYVAVGVASLSWALNGDQVRTLTERLVLEVLVFLAIGTFLLRREQLRAVAGTMLAAGVASTLLGVLLGAQEFERMIGTFTDPNEYAAAMVASIGFGYGALGAARTPWGRRACVAGMLVCGWGVLASQSRGGLVALAAAGAWIVLSSRGRERVRLMGASLVMLAAGVSVLMLTPTGQESLQRITNGDSSGRSDLWRIAVLEYQSAPLHGVGLGNYPVQAPRFVNEKTEHTELVNSAAPRTTHNSYLEIAAELGTLGLAAFGLFAFGSVLLGMRGVRVARRLGDSGAVRLGRGIVAAALGLLGACAFLSNHYSELLWATLAACVAFHAYAVRQQRMAAAIETAHQIVENMPIDEVDADLSEALAVAALDELDAMPELEPRT
jgi:O-antigen ligase